ncbi:L-lactate dehydrogenase [Pseudomonas sp. N040]|uniref:L-lactate dehydrogenase n=1 Tax=Pseudomonas sp. N040 TaxID=2785325 RepID=UPI0018A2CCF7|nr:L-lactate dehydrogenase [Pseudomonas sp. N040]MBF7729442.1 L-lactate dehydrogenase [Pseudomonas sp. N040]MBW7013082.1 L-lactate dehydrogenase [Pseudomonas sp. N040]
MGRTLNLLPATALDYRRLAEARLPRFLFDYIDGGANDERTLASNVDDFAKVLIRQRVLCNVDHLDTSTSIAGCPASMPLVLAPVGMAGLFGRRGEVQGVRAANKAGIPFTLSTVGICPLDEIQAAASAPFWFQLYMIRDRGVIRDLLDRAMASGCDTLLFTVDLPMPGMRHRDTRNGMLGSGMKSALGKAWQLGTRPGWVWDVGINGKPHSFGNLAHVVPDPTDLAAFGSWINQQFDTSVTWKDIEWLRGIWKGKLLLKGIQEVADARSALDVGADGLVVSNHGGRQLDGVASSIAKLPAIAEAVGERLEVLMDGGVRSGVDVFKAVALGARAVLIGRPWVWAMAGAGEQGLGDLLATFKRELEIAMALSGVTRIEQISRANIDSMPW